jgi:hypothetical protein
MSFQASSPDFWPKLKGKIKTHTFDQGEMMGFSEVFIHPMYKDYGNYEDYDLAILRFKARIKSFSPKVLPICVPQISEF